jgi:hypothetical protein
MSLTHACTGLSCIAMHAQSCLNMTPGSVVYQDNPKVGKNFTKILHLQVKE